MYEVLKIITLPDTNLTRLIKYNDIKSKMKTILTKVDLRDNNSHSIITSSILIKRKAK